MSHSDCAGKKQPIRSKRGRRLTWDAEERAVALAEKKRLADDALAAELANLDAEIERDEAIARQEDERPGFMGPVYHGEPDSTLWR